MIVLDTHEWLWWVAAPERLSQAAREAVERARVCVSTLSAWEIAMLSTRGRISLDRDVGLWVGQALADARTESLAPSAEVAVAAACSIPSVSRAIRWTG